MSHATHPLLGKDALTALAPLVTYPARCWLALTPSVLPERQPAAITFFESTAIPERKAA
jgi:hypothetical protein